MRPLAPIYSPAVSVQQGSYTVTVTGNIDCSAFNFGTMLHIGNYAPTTAASGTEPDANGISTVMLSRPWAGPDVTGEQMLASMTYQDLLAAIYTLQDLRAAVNPLKEQLANEFSSTSIAGQSAHKVASATSFTRELIENFVTPQDILDALDADVNLDVLADENTESIIAGVPARRLAQTVIQVSHLKALPTTNLVNGQQYSVTSFYPYIAPALDSRPVGGGKYVYDATRSASAHNGSTIIAVAALNAWDGLENSVNGFINWSGTGTGCFVLTGAKTLKVSDFIVNPNSALSVTQGLDRLASVLVDNSLVFLDIPFVAPSTQFVITKQNVSFIGGVIVRDNNAAEYPIWVGNKDNAAKGTTFYGFTLIGNSAPYQWGKQGVYLRNAQNTGFIGCKFYTIGDAAIRLGASFPANSTDPARFTTLTDGVQLIGCLFEDCTQITTNNSGAHSVIFSGCTFRRVYSVKFTQRNLVKCRTSKLIGCIFDDVERVLEVQGGGNVELIDCTGTAQQLLTAYSNSSSAVDGTHIPYGNIKVIGGSYTLKTTSFANYLETTELAGNRTLNYGNIEFRGVDVKSESGAAIFLRAHTNASVTLSQHPNIIVDDCTLSGFTEKELVSATVNTIDNWRFQFSNTEFDQSAIPVLLDLRQGGDWHIDISANKGVVNRQVFTLNQAEIGQTFKLSSNQFKCGTHPETDFAFITLLSSAFGFRARQVEYEDNTLDFTEHWKSVICHIAQPRVADSRLVMGGNKLYLPKPGATGTLPRPVYVDSRSGLGWDNVLACYPSYVFGEGRKLRAEGASGLSYSALELEYIWLGKEPSRRLLRRIFAENLAGVTGSWRVLEIYSDGVVKSYGRHINNSQNTFNVYFPFSTSAILPEPFVPNIIPEQACIPHFVQQLGNGFTVRFTNLTGADISPWFRYSVEYKITLTEVSNYVGGN